MADEANGSGGVAGIVVCNDGVVKFLAQFQGKKFQYCAFFPVFFKS